MRDEEIELTSPDAVAAVRPRAPSPEVELKRWGSSARDKGKARAVDDGDDDATRAAGMSDLQRAISTSTSFAGGGGGMTPGYEESDPLLLRSRLVDETDLRRRPTNSSGRRAVKDVKKFYEDQNEHIERLLKPMHAHKQSDEDDRRDNAIKVKLAVYGSLAANCILAVLQLYAAISSLSLSLFATAADSVFDPFANLALNWLHRKAKRVDERRWPAGGSRFENVGNCVYAFLMGAVSIILVVESIRDIATHSADEDTNKLHIPSLVAVGVAFGVKFALFLYCMALRRFSSQVQVLWEDHRNDLFINGLGILTSALGSKIAWWIDPAGAMLISLMIIVSWTLTAKENFAQLAGFAAPTEFLQLVTYNAMLFHDRIEKIDSVKAYHSGSKYVVECDVVMSGDTPLWEAHDVSQDLQDKLEALPDVERAYVHVDHEVSHAPEHRKQA